MTSGGNRNCGAKPKITTDMGVYVPPGVEGALAEMPGELSDDGKQVWDVLIPDLVAHQVFAPSDVVMVVELCELLAEARQFRRRLQRLRARMEEVENELADADTESDRYEQLLKQETAVDQALKRARSGWLQTLSRAQSMSGEFGVSPVARIRLGLAKLQGASLLEQLKTLEASDSLDDEIVVTGSASPLPPDLGTAL